MLNGVKLNYSLICADTVLCEHVVVDVGILQILILPLREVEIFMKSWKPC